MRIREAQRHTDHTDPDPDPQHWLKESDSIPKLKHTKQRKRLKDNNHMRLSIVCEKKNIP